MAGRDFTGTPCISYCRAYTLTYTLMLIFTATEPVVVTKVHWTWSPLSTGGEMRWVQQQAPSFTDCLLSNIAAPARGEWLLLVRTEALAWSEVEQSSSGMSIGVTTVSTARREARSSSRQLTGTAGVLEVGQCRTSRFGAARRVTPSTSMDGR